MNWILRGSALLRRWFMYYRSEIHVGYDNQQEWSFCPEDPNDNTGTPCETQAQYEKDLLPETYP